MLRAIVLTSCVLLMLSCFADGAPAPVIAAKNVTVCLTNTTGNFTVAGSFVNNTFVNGRFVSGNFVNQTTIRAIFVNGSFVNGSFVSGNITGYSCPSTSSSKKDLFASIGLSIFGVLVVLGILVWSFNK